MNSTINVQNLYDQDFVQWCEVTASQLRDRAFEQVDLDNLVD
ncbi:MAG: DUF29 domain-containing protein [Cyanobacteria bacterium]|nr:DUF29 domain-containing protein [Cyanobacteriota bacterium]MDW8200663.1 DUF29 family protein [Cyanobacteriota bacterium SKYGB_h_bin112]